MFGNLFGHGNTVSSTQIQQLYEFQASFSTALLSVLEEDGVLTPEQAQRVFSRYTQLAKDFDKTRLVKRNLIKEHPLSTITAPTEKRDTQTTHQALNALLNLKLKDFKEIIALGPPAEDVAIEEKHYREIVDEWLKALDCKHDFEKNSWSSRQPCKKCKFEAGILKKIKIKLFILDELDVDSSHYPGVRALCKEIYDCQHNITPPLFILGARCDKCKTDEAIIKEIEARFEKNDVGST